MYAILIKPLSANDAWTISPTTGRRIKTQAYRDYAEELFYKLPPLSYDPSLKYTVIYEFGISYSGMDFDNCIKQFQDCMSKKYGINDSHYWEAHIRKVKVKKGAEYIRFYILEDQGISLWENYINNRIKCQ